VPSVTSAPSSTTAAAAPTPTPLPPALAGNPERIRIATIGLDAPLEALGPDANNNLRDPSDPARLVGWYPDYGKPGTPGNTYLSAFVFYQEKPGPFRRLAELQAGDSVELLDKDGGVATYRVIKRQRYEAATLPFGDILFAPDRPAQAEWLTMMTGGGEVGPNGNYLQNDVVVAERTR
jgi:hypothetical protein